MSLTTLNVIFVLLILCNAQERNKNYCTDKFLFKDMPGGIIKEMFLMATIGKIQTLVGCKPVHVEEDLIKFLLYNRRNLNTPISLNQFNLPELDPTKPIIFQIHGWLCDFSNDRMPELKNAYLSRYDANVIIVDWSQYSIDYYIKCFCYVPLIAKVIGKFICYVAETLNVDVNKIHVIGHSMGGQIAGLSGKEVQLQCGKIIGRITGLDPAGPLYQKLPTDEKLHETDARQVDVIHSNMGFMGYFGTCGTSDFFANSGVFQPGCLKLRNIKSTEELFNLPFAYILCSHVRSLDYMIESITSTYPKFIGKNCDWVPVLPIIGLRGEWVTTRNITELGENCPFNPPGRKFWLNTNKQAPFAQG